jgi:hypothetical protein
VSCPDWNALTAHRRQRDAAEPAGWDAAVAHLDGCGICRRLAAVPAVTMTGSEERSEADAVRVAVAAMRAASRLDSLEARPRALSRASSGGLRRWSIAAVAAVLALAVLAAPAGHDDSGRLAARTPDNAAIFREGLVLPASQQADFGEPVVEGVNLPDARVYHMSGEGLSVVMVVDESLDI